MRNRKSAVLTWLVAAATSVIVMTSAVPGAANPDDSQEIFRTASTEALRQQNAGGYGLGRLCNGRTPTAILTDLRQANGEAPVDEDNPDGGDTIAGPAWYGGPIDDVVIVDLDYPLWNRMVVDGGGGNDTICVYSEDVRSVQGGEGNDWIWFAPDILPWAYGGDGDDTMLMAPGDQEGYSYLDGGPGNDVLLGAAGPDGLIGCGTFGEVAIDDDHLFGLGGIDFLDGGPGNDYLNGGDSRDELYGGEGDDYIWSEWFDNDLVVAGGQSNDVIDDGS